MTVPVIEIKDLTIGYDDLIVLNKANFSVRKGEVFTLLGGSGCGKTTLMRNIIGLETPLSGEILINGVDVAKADATAQAVLSQDVGVMFQSGALISAMSLLENVMLPINEHSTLPNNVAMEVAMLKLRLVGLEKFAHYYPSDISGGMLKRAAIARAMALDPSVIFLDEPSAGLDPISHRELDQLIKSLSENLGITFVIVTHELETILSIVDHAIVLNNQTIVADGDINHIRQCNDPFIQTYFEGVA